MTNQSEVKMKLITIMTPCYNEEDGIRDCYIKVRDFFNTEIKNYTYEHLFIDNCSSDGTVEILREIAKSDKGVKIIVNSRNFGLAKSPYHAFLEATGDAVIPIVADLQTPPHLIHKFIERWEEGYLMVLGVRVGMEEGWILRKTRELFYNLISRLSHVEQFKHFIGYGLFDRKIIKIMRNLDDPAPYFRGIISEIGFKKAIVEYHQPPRLHGKSRHTFLDLLDLAIHGIISYSKAPLRIMTIGGAVLSAVSLALSFLFLIVKIIFWNSFDVGIAPLLIGLFFFSSINLFFLGLIGEYVGVIMEYVRKRPLVIEQERINF